MQRAWLTYHIGCCGSSGTECERQYCFGSSEVQRESRKIVVDDKQAACSPAQVGSWMSWQAFKSAYYLLCACSALFMRVMCTDKRGSAHTLPLLAGTSAPFGGEPSAGLGLDALMPGFLP